LPPAPVIDLHTHILPERWPDWTARSGYAGWIELAHERPGCARMQQTLPGGGRQSFREIHANCWDPLTRLNEMDARSVDIQVLSTVPVMFSYWALAPDALDLARLLNDHIAEVCRAHPGRFIGLATLPMQDPALACRELERCVNQLGLAGIEIGTHVNGQNLDTPGIEEVLAHAALLNAAVFVHPWDMLRHTAIEQMVELPTGEAARVYCVCGWGGVGASLYENVDCNAMIQSLARVPQHSAMRLKWSVSAKLAVGTPPVADATSAE
jgi:aminocarboxymuconate-semialdehyde decarboxylase